MQPFQPEIFNAEIPKDSTCHFIQEGTHTHTQCARPVEAEAEVQSGAHLSWGSLFLFHGLCFPLMMGPLSVLPVDLHHSGLLIKPPFTKPKQGTKEGKK